MHKGWHFVDETERRKWQNPEAILQNIGLKPGFTFMDIGCGAGFFTLPAARITGPTGKIYGVDIAGEALNEIRRKASAEGLPNLELTTGKAEDTILCQACADIVFFGIVLHDFEDPATVLQNARRMLKPQGKLINLDWKKVTMSFGPPVSRRFDEEFASHLIEAAGFKIDDIKDSGIYHYIITARPKV